jgi:inorganic triphosphatase YgiF
MPAEIELKLTLEGTAAPRASELLKHPAVRAVRHGRARTARVTSTYYDTPTFTLEEERFALRVRRDGARYVQTVEGPPLDAAADALHAHDAHEWRLAHARLDPARLAETPWRKLFARAQKRGLAPVFTTDVVRRSLPLVFPDGTRATIAVDVGTIRRQRAPGRRVKIAEVEIDLDHGAPAAAYDLALALLEDWPLSVATTSKAARGYALVHGSAAGERDPVRAGAVAFSLDGPAEKALASILGECVGQIAGNAAGLVDDNDPEWVHQMRIGTRRLRSCLALVAKVAGRATVAPLTAEVRWLARILGTARDLDVFATETLPPLTAAVIRDPAAAPGLKRLARTIGIRRRAALAAAREAVRSRRFQRLLLAGGSLSATLAATSIEPTTAREFSDRLLTKRHGELGTRGAELEHATPEERHAVRVAAKKLRYVAEFFAPDDRGKRHRRYLKALARLQNALGHWHDAVTATRLTEEVSGKSDPATIGAVRGWAAAQMTAVEPEIADAWKRFAATDTFWNT